MFLYVRRSNAYRETKKIPNFGNDETQNNEKKKKTEILQWDKEFNKRNQIKIYLFGALREMPKKGVDSHQYR